MASVVKIKRSAVAGKRPTTSNIETGEIALNLSDGRLYSSDGSTVFEIGANPHSLSVGAGAFSIANGAITFPTSDGSTGYFLKTDGAGTLSWDTAAGAIGSQYVSNSYFQPVLANTNAWLTASNTAIADRMQVANVISYTAKYLEVANSANLGEVSNSYLTSTYTSNATFQAFVANTNAYIAASAASGGLSNTEVDSRIDAKIQVLDIGDIVNADGNSGQILISYGDGTAYWSNNNPSVDLSGYVGNTYLQSTFVSNTAFQSALANTNVYIATKLDSSSYTTADVQSKAALANTNAYIASVSATERSALANTNSYIATKLDSSSYTTADVQSKAALANTNTRIDLINTNLTSTNTALRTLISDRLQLANAESLYVSLSGDTMTGTLTLSGAPSADLHAATKKYVDDEVAGLVDSAPATLDTLNELAAALGDNPNFATTVTTNLGQKLGATASITLTGDVTGSGSFSSNSVSIALTDTNLGNTNAYIASESARIDLVNTNLTGTNTAIRTLVSDRMQVANVVSYTAKYLEVANSASLGEVSNSYLTSTYTSNATFQAFVANTNAYIASKTDDTVVLATNTALRTLINDRMQVANVNLLVNDRIQVANLNTTLSDYWPSANVIAHVSTEIASLVDTAPTTLDTLNELAAALGDDANFATTVTTNLGQKLGATASVTLTGDVTGSGSFSSNAVSIALTDTNLANTNSYIATKLDSSSYTTADVQSKAALANTNSYIATKLDSSSYTTADVQSKAALANTNAYIATKLDSSSYTTADVQSKAALANTNAYIASVAASAGSGNVSNSYLTSTYTSNAVFQAFVANTNAYIAASAGSGGLSNTEVDSRIDAKIQLLDVGDIVGADGNSGQILFSYGDGTAYWSNNNPSVDLSGYVGNTYLQSTFVSNTAFQSALANTNAYIATKTDDTVVLATNTALRTLINDRMQVANVVSYTAKYLEVANVTTTDTSSLATWSALIATNTSIRSAISTEVANLVDSAPAALDTLNELAAALGDDANFSATVTTSLAGKASNAAFQSALANTNIYIATKLDSSSYTTADVQSKAALANTNSYIATKLDSSSYTTADVQSKAALANTNAYIATKANESDSLSRLANTNSYIATKLDSSSYTTADVQSKAALANTNAYIATKLDSSSYTTADVQSKAALANTNAYIASVAASAGSGGLSNTEVDSRIDAKIQVLDIGDIVNADGTAGQVLITNGDGTGYWANVATGSSFEYVYFASNNQTSFSGADFYSKTLSYTAGKIAVFLNGIKLLRTDYTAANGTHVVLQAGAAANDSIEILSFNGSRLVI